MYRAQRSAASDVAIYMQAYNLVNEYL